MATIASKANKGWFSPRRTLSYILFAGEAIIPHASIPPSSATVARDGPNSLATARLTEWSVFIGNS